MASINFSEKVLKAGNGDEILVLSKECCIQRDASYAIMGVCDEIKKLEISIGYFSDSDIDMIEDLSYETITLQSLRMVREILKKKLMMCVLEGGEI